MRNPSFILNIFLGIKLLEKWETSNLCNFLNLGYISRLEENTIIVGTSADEPSKNVAEFKTALSDLGISTDLLVKNMYRGSFAFIAMKGQRQRSIIKMRKRKNGPCYLAHTLIYGETLGTYYA